MNNYRPEGFKNPYSEKPFSFEDCKLQEAFEAGADAMLEGLRKQGDCSINELVSLMIHHVTGLAQNDGKWVFIPEEA